MRKNIEPKKFSVKALRGFVGEDGKNVKAGILVMVGRNLAKILASTGRGEIQSDKGKAES